MCREGGEVTESGNLSFEDNSGSCLREEVFLINEKNTDQILNAEEIYYVDKFLDLYDTFVKNLK